MKKILILLAAILLGVSASFAQVDIVNVSRNWDPEECPCGSVLTDYFKVTVSIYDDANGEWVVQNKTVTTSNTTYTDMDVDVSEVDTYCNKDHDYTPVFTVYAWVWLMDTSTNPPTECCSGSDDYGSYNCHDFYNAIVYLKPAITLN